MHKHRDDTLSQEEPDETNQIIANQSSTDTVVPPLNALTPSDSPTKIQEMKRKDHMQVALDQIKPSSENVKKTISTIVDTTEHNARVLVYI